jgi:hypothetical protein
LPVQAAGGVPDPHVLFQSNKFPFIPFVIPGLKVLTLKDPYYPDIKYEDPTNILTGDIVEGVTDHSLVGASNPGPLVIEV